MNGTIVLLLCHTMCDDVYGTTYHEAKICKSVEDANKVILECFNERFETDCKSVQEVVKEVKKDEPDFNIGCYNEEGEFKPYWEDNCNGKWFEVTEFDTTSTDWQQLFTQMC